MKRFIIGFSMAMIAAVLYTEIPVNQVHRWFIPHILGILTGIIIIKWEK